MNEAIANLLKRQVMTIDFADKVAGLVRPVRINVNEVQKSFPVSWDFTAEQVCNKYMDLMPCSDYKSLVYFEDNGTTFLDRIGDVQLFQSSLRLVGWINTSKFPQFKCPHPLSTEMILQITKAFPLGFFNDGQFIKIQIILNSEAVKNPSIFGAYTYDELTSQYLFYPYDYFALNITVNYGYNINC